MKKPYFKIQLKNCNTDYDYTICEWSDVLDYIELVKQNGEDFTEENYPVFEKEGWLPEANISIVMMTESEYEDWFRNNIEAGA